MVLASRRVRVAGLLVGGQWLHLYLQKQLKLYQRHRHRLVFVGPHNLGRVQEIRRIKRVSSLMQGKVP